jgi:magnesium transporter
MSTLSADRLHDPILPHVQPCPVTLRATDRVDTALDAIRRARLGDVPHFYVVDDEARLAGLVRAHVLLESAVDEVIGDLMVHDAVAIPDWATVLVAAEFFASQPSRAFPVVGRGGELLGQVDTRLFTPEIVALAGRSFEDIFQLIGIHASGNNSAWSSFKDRFPWLMANIAGGLLCAGLASRYEALLDAVVVLALFIPVVLALAESVSMQSLTLTLQRLHGGPPVRGFLRRMILMELGAAALLGIGCGAVVATTVALWKGDGVLGAVIGIAIAAAVVTAGLFGLLLPTVLHALRRDPRIAAGPIVLAASDVATLLFYFNLAGWWLGSR